MRQSVRGIAQGAWRGALGSVRGAVLSLALRTSAQALVVLSSKLGPIIAELPVINWRIPAAAALLLPATPPPPNSCSADCPRHSTTVPGRRLGTRGTWDGQCDQRAVSRMRWNDTTPMDEEPGPESAYVTPEREVGHSGSTGGPGGHAGSQGVLITQPSGSEPDHVD
ncbi:hypothetical protein NDU88_001401 [Pleurodeles waltl]|uniref:Uncharacterized protein n=1 Tax=Pleurodeles waltl TaxID=8319 RepID=A0AAV7S7G8_PLEWA|nr:hypothetical protein NDU88_001401 [Pleurodeles waltl]